MKLSMAHDLAVHYVEVKTRGTTEVGVITCRIDTDHRTEYDVYVWNGMVAIHDVFGNIVAEYERNVAEKNTTMKRTAMLKAAKHFRTIVW